MTDIAQGIDETYVIRQVDDAPHREEQERIDWLERRVEFEATDTSEQYDVYDPDDYLDAYDEYDLEDDPIDDNEPYVDHEEGYSE